MRTIGGRNYQRPEGPQNPTAQAPSALESAHLTGETETRSTNTPEKAEQLNTQAWRCSNRPQFERGSPQ